MDRARVIQKLVFILSTLLFASCHTPSPNYKPSDLELSAAAQSQNSGETLSSERNPASIGNDSKNASKLPPKKLEVGAEQAIDGNFMRTQADYHFTLAEAMSLDGDTSHSIEEYKLALMYDSKSPHLRMKLATELVKSGQLVQAVDQAETAVQLDPKLTDARLLLGGLYSSSKLYDKAIEEYSAAMKLDPSNLEAALYVGALLAEQKKYDESVAHFKRVAAASKAHSHVAYYYLGRVELERQHQKEAVDAFKKSLLIKPDFLESVMALGYAYEQKEKFKDAEAVYRAYQEKFGPSSKVAAVLGKIYMDKDEYDKAFKQFVIIEAQEPDNLNVKVKMALILIENKKYPEAVARLKNILSIAPDSEKIRFYLAAVYEEIKAYDDAIEQFMTIKPASTLYAESAIHAAYLHKLNNHLPEAIELMGSAVKLRPDVPQFYSFYASLLDDQKTPEKAVAILESGVQRFPKDDQLYFYLGSMQDKSGMRNASIETLKKAIELNPEHIQALNYLGYTLTEMNQQLPDAENYIRRALKLKPEDGYITDSLGWVLYREGKVKEAVTVLERAYKLKPDEAIIAEHLGDAYQRASLFDRARQMYLKAVTLESDENAIVKIKRKIADVEDLTHPTSQKRNSASVATEPEDSATK